VGEVERRLTDLGIDLPPVAPPLAVYVPAVRSGSLVFTAGQLPLRDGTLMAQGIVGVDVDVATATECARQCALNAVAAVNGVLGDLDLVARVVKVVGFVASAPSFTGHPAVVNGASEVLGEIFGDAGVHARSAVGVASLPLGAPVEVELIVQVADGPAAPLAR
jgi:enamine deaminase RidA (YjgF/YER057c/UK114 family)